ncbi:MAG: hypothetical protein ABSC06_36305 [Rhodopila sp.]
MQQSVRYTIRFDGMEAADAGRAAESLRQTLLDVDPTIQATRVRTDAEVMDFGATLAIILAAPAIVELAKGITNWLARSHSSRLTVIGPDGSTIVENISARQAAGLAEKLQAGHGEG